MLAMAYTSRGSLQILRIVRFGSLAVPARCKALANAHSSYVVVLRRVRTENAQQFPITRAMRVQYSKISAWILLDRPWPPRLESYIRQRGASRSSVINCA